MLLSAYQAALHWGHQSIEREDARATKTTAASASRNRMSAFATCMSKGLERYWNVPANDPKIRAEIDLLPKRIL